jgi:hypothetical protein
MPEKFRYIDCLGVDFAEVKAAFASNHGILSILETVP